MKKILTDVLCILVVLAVVVVGNPDIAYAKKVSSGKVQAAYHQMIEKLKKKEAYKKGVYAATVKSAEGADVLLIAAGFGEDGSYVYDKDKAIAAKIYQYVKGKVIYIGKICSTGTGYPLCGKGTWLYSGYHHESYRYSIKNGIAFIEGLSGLYTEKGTCYYTKYSMKKNKWTKIQQKKISAKTAEKRDYYLNHCERTIFFEKRD